jgi:hypothetical protein
MLVEKSLLMRAVFSEANVVIVEPADYFRQFYQLFWQCLLKRFIGQSASVT